MSKRKWKKPLNIALSAGLVASVVIPAVPPAAVAATNAADLIISEYVEGSSFNKAIELYNGTGEEIDLSDYTLEHYNNSGTAATGTTTTDKVLPLEGKLADGETFVVSRSDANAAILAVTDLTDDKQKCN